MTVHTRLRTRTVVVPFALRRGPASSDVVRAIGGETMGTTWSVKAPLEEAALAELRTEVEGVLAILANDLSAWDPDSALSRFNHGARGWHSLPQSLCAVLARALTIARETSGAYDPTVWPLVELWGFGPGGATSFPPAKPSLPPSAAATTAGLG